MISRILMPLDGSTLARSALETVVSLARTHDASVIVFGCLALNEIIGSGVEMSPMTFDNVWSERKDELLDHLHKAATEVKRAGLVAEIAWSSGRPVEQIVEAAKSSECDCIVMASRRREGLRRWMIGSVTEGVLRKAPCPIFVVPREKNHQIFSRKRQLILPVAP